MNRKNNRRSQITKRIFRETLLELLRDDHISNISVKALCEAANLNRSTFYSYYQNNMELLQEIENETYARVEMFIKSGLVPGETVNQKLIFREFLGYVKENRELFLVLFGDNGSQDFQEKIIELILQIVDEYGVDIKKIMGKKRVYSRCYRAAGIANTIERWIRNEFDLSVNEMAGLLINLSTEKTGSKIDENRTVPATRKY